LVKKIEILIKDKDTREIMGKNGRILALREFEVSRVIEQYIELYSKF